MLSFNSSGRTFAITPRCMRQVCPTRYPRQLAQVCDISTRVDVSIIIERNSSACSSPYLRLSFSTGYLSLPQQRCSQRCHRLPAGSHMCSRQRVRNPAQVRLRLSECHGCYLGSGGCSTHRSALSVPGCPQSKVAVTMPTISTASNLFWGLLVIAVFSCLAATGNKPALTRSRVACKFNFMRDTVRW